MGWSRIRNALGCFASERAKALASTLDKFQGVCRKRYHTSIGNIVGGVRVVGVRKGGGGGVRVFFLFVQCLQRQHCRGVRYTTQEQNRPHRRSLTPTSRSVSPYRFKESPRSASARRSILKQYEGSVSRELPDELRGEAQEVGTSEKILPRSFFFDSLCFFCL